MNEQQSATTTVPTAQEVFGLPQGCRVVLQLAMPDFVFQMMASKRADLGAVVEAFDGRSATIMLANDEEMELRLDGPIRIGSDYDDLVVRLARAANSLFTLSISGAGVVPLSYQFADLTITREGGSFVLASGESRVRFTPGAATVNIEGYTAPFLAQAPAMVRAFAPEVVALFNVTAEEKLRASTPTPPATATCVTLAPAHTARSSELE